MTAVDLAGRAIINKTNKKGPGDAGALMLMSGKP